jgi:tRNA pseudouridine32 synthase/23S rRNA pseudouridine746 synthase
MSSPENLFIKFKTSIDSYTLPEKFTFPFYYQPHPLCQLAVSELQSYLETQTDWQHNFGLNGDKETAIGKMFGVLLVRSHRGEIGYLAAFSGKVADSNHWPHLVPPVFDMLDEHSFFKQDYAEIKQITDQISILEQNPNIAILAESLEQIEQAAKQAIQAHRSLMIEGRKERKIRRRQAENDLAHADLLKLKEQLSQQSIQHKNQLRDLNNYWDEQIQSVQEQLLELNTEIDDLKTKRKALSVALQNKLFDQYQFLNQFGVEKNLRQLFMATAQQIPPAGAGECAAPKLLHYAFKHGMQPLALAEFWWGSSPKSQIRLHKNYYAACQGKCQPILAHMLDGIEMDDNPLLNNPAAGKTIDIIYQDDVMVVINKPAEFLSVPGKNIEDSVFARMKQAFPMADSPLIVHRLDMSTSGLMVIALTREAHKNLQKQFISRTVEKRYIALIDGLLKDDEGVINLPLRVDLDDRPRQMVCYQYGRAAETHWQVIARTEARTKVYFYPKTGRTHQLRMHSAHADGLNSPIVGDDLYGNKAERLYLHAESLAFQHPSTREKMYFQVDAEF